MSIKFGSVCSGIEAASVAWEPLGWKAAWFSEIEKFPSELLAQRYPGVKNLGDMRGIAKQIRRGAIEAPEIIVGGTPCQAFSVAGLRNSLEDARGQLTLHFVDLANAVDEQRAAIRLGASIVVWENVPGVLSAAGNAFGCFLAGLAGEGEPLEPPGEKWSDAGCVFGPQRAVAWRCLDAQYFGLAQRRKRVFVIASAREGFDPSKVLFEFDGVRRDSPPSREAGQEAAGNPPICTSGGGGPGTAEDIIGYLSGVCPTLRAGGNSTGGVRPPGTDVDTADSLVAVFGGNNTRGPIQISPALNACATASGRQEFESECFIVRTSQTSSNGCGVNTHLAYTLDGANGQAVAFAENSRAEVRLEGGDGQIFGTLSTGGGKPGQGAPTIAGGSGVRRLMPVECEALQGFPRGYTAITINGKPAADGPRYKALGNSMAVPCMHWLGQRIQVEL